MTPALLHEFAGWLSVDIAELHNVEVPRLADSLDRFLAARAAASRPDERAGRFLDATTCETCRHCHDPRPLTGHRTMCWHPLVGDANKSAGALVPVPFGCVLHELREGGQ